MAGKVEPRHTPKDRLRHSHHRVHAAHQAVHDHAASTAAAVYSELDVTLAAAHEAGATQQPDDKESTP